ncbi:MAG: LacI family DNA-binding transcriptional regulator [Granulosicoccus sp.]
MLRSVSLFKVGDTVASDEVPSIVTAENVAALAGVSRWTVNRAFKQDASISLKSREKVMAAAESLGYVPDLLAASLASDQSNLVSLLVDDFANPHKLVMMERLTRILREQGWDTLLVNTQGQDDASAALLKSSQRRVDAAVLIGSQFTDQILSTALHTQRVRKLVVFARASERAGTISICCDDIAAMNEITRYVLEKQYQRPLFVAGPQTRSAHLLRKETFLSLWREAKGVDANCTVVGSYDPVLAYRHVYTYLAKLKSSDWPDILVCENDSLAMGAIDAIRYEFNLSVPEDIAVTGFDDVPQASSPHYKLTTYRQPISKMAEALVSVLRGNKEPSKLDRFLGQIVKRESA